MRESTRERDARGPGSRRLRESNRLGLSTREKPGSKIEARPQDARVNDGNRV